VAEHQPFPRPFIITVGVPKGGDCKSWLALNFASRLGMWGHDVLVVDCNQQHDLVVDYMTLTNRGVYPRFDVLMHTPLSPEGLPAAPLDLKVAHHRDFIVFDTAQFVEFPTTRWAWANCHLMLVPVTPHTSQRHNYQTAIRLFHALPGQRPPIAAVPCKIDVLKNSKPHPDAFRMALRAAGAPRAVWMVGDNPIADVRGAEAMGIPAILVRTQASVERRVEGLEQAASLILDG
jgi:hypothetical protein